MKMSNWSRKPDTTGKAVVGTSCVDYAAPVGTRIPDEKNKDEKNKGVAVLSYAAGRPIDVRVDTFQDGDKKRIRIEARKSDNPDDVKPVVLSPDEYSFYKRIESQIVYKLETAREEGASVGLISEPI